MGKVTIVFVVGIALMAVATAASVRELSLPGLWIVGAVLTAAAGLVMLGSSTDKK